MREQRALEERESCLWTELQRDFERVLADENVSTRPWYQADREADATHVLLRSQEPETLFTVRANHDCLLTPSSKGTDGKALRKLREALLESPSRGVTYLDLPRHRHCTERMARMEVTCERVSLRLRQRWSHKFLADAELYAVWTHEVGTTPAGEAPIEWLLLNTYPVTTIEAAFCVVRA
ncbi:MAG: hypothetical protein HY909_18590 [Deltaproteobacteria bacterium]|nr:hypothetical protein [Deltaproteobacteria bacterium]